MKRCVDCAADISSRHFNAYLCRACRIRRDRLGKRQYAREHLEDHRLYQRSRRWRPGGFLNPPTKVGRQQVCATPLCGQKFIARSGNHFFCLECSKANVAYIRQRIARRAA